MYYNSAFECMIKYACRVEAEPMRVFCFGQNLTKCVCPILSIETTLLKIITNKKIACILICLICCYCNVLIHKFSASLWNKNTLHGIKHGNLVTQIFVESATLRRKENNVGPMDPGDQRICKAWAAATFPWRNTRPPQQSAGLAHCRGLCGCSDYLAPGRET